MFATVVVTATLPSAEVFGGESECLHDVGERDGLVPRVEAEVVADVLDVVEERVDPLERCRVGCHAASLVIIGRLVVAAAAAQLRTRGS